MTMSSFKMDINSLRFYVQGKGKIQINIDTNNFAKIYLKGDLIATYKAPFFGKRDLYSVIRNEEGPDDLGNWTELIAWAVKAKSNEIKYYGYGDWEHPDQPL